MFFPAAQFSEADIARSLLFTISNDIGQIACLYAMMHGLKKVSDSIFHKSFYFWDREFRLLRFCAFVGCI